MALLDNLDFLTPTTKNRASLKLIKNMAQTRASHAFLFLGSSPDCLYRLALAFAASINCPQSGCGNCRICKNTCKGMDAHVLTMEAEGNFLVKEDVVQIKKFVSMTAPAGRKKIVIIRQSETMNDAFANKFLKTLEEPPDENCLFVLLASQAQKLLPTIVSRCMEFEWTFAPGSQEDSAVDLGALEKIVHAGLKKIVQGEVAAAMGLGSQVCQMLADISQEQKKAFQKELKLRKETSADPVQAEREAKLAAQRQQRRLARLNKLGMDCVFDIIVAWLEDMIAVKAGAGQDVLHYAHNYTLIDASIFDINLEKLWAILKDIDRNKKFMGRSLNAELALDSIFLHLRDALRGD